MLLLAGSAWATSCPSGYSNWFPLSSLAQGSTTTNQTNFPMLFIGGSYLATTGNSGYSLNSGLDVTFCTGNNTGNLLPYELVTGTYSATTGAGEWWVQMPTVSYNTAETIYVGVGKSSANDSNAAGVWSAYLGIWHFGTSSTLTLTDSTGNHTATNHSATAAAGKIGGAGAFVHATPTYIDTGGVLNPGTSNQISMLAWVDPASGFDACQRVLSNLVSPTYAGYELIVGGGCVANGQVEIQTATGGNLSSLYSTAAISAGAWSHIATTQNGTGNTNQRVYINGANQAGTGAGTYAIGNSTNDMAIGAVVAISGYAFNGLIDEVEIYNGVLTADWIKDAYNNQSAPGSFSSFNALPPIIIASWAGSGTSTGAAVNVAPTAGDTLIIGLTALSTSALTTSVQANSTPCTQDSAVWVSSQWYMYFYRCSNIASGITTVTPTLSTSTNWFITIEDVQNLITSPVDVMDTTGHYNGGSAATWSSAAITTNSATDIIFGLGVNASNNTLLNASTPYLNVNQVSLGAKSAALIAQIVSVTGSYQPNGTGPANSNLYAIAASYKGTSPTVATPTFPSATDASVTISTATSGATLYYCQAASACTPTTSGQVYSSSFAPVFPEVCAIGTLTGSSNSAVACTAVSSVTPSFSSQPAVLYSSPSSIAVTFVTALPASIKGECGTSSGGPYTTEVTPEVYTEGWQRTSFTGTTTAWGTSFAITGLHQASLYYCVVVAYDVTHASNTQSSEFSATTTTLSTIPVTVGATSQITRLDDQANAANGIAQANIIAGTWTPGTNFTLNEQVKQGTTNATANILIVPYAASAGQLIVGPVSGSPDSNPAHTWVGQNSTAVFAPSATPSGWFVHGDTETGTVAEDGNFYGFCHDCYGVGAMFPNTIGFFKWNSAHTVATQLGPLCTSCGGVGQTGFGYSGTLSGYVGWTDGGTWEAWGLQSVRGQIYQPLWRCWPSGLTYCGDFNMFRSSDHLLHTLSAGNQFAQGLGSNSAVVSNFDVPVAPAVMPNNPTPGSINGGTTSGFIPFAGHIQTCQDESMNCTAQANNDGYIYSWGSCAPNICLTRIRVEDLPLMDASKWQIYTGSHSGDDGIYDSAWSSTPSASTNFGTGFCMGALWMTQFVPDFNRFLFLCTVSNVVGSSVTLYDLGPYPWGNQVAAGSASWTNDQWPGYYVSFGQINPGSYLKTSTTPLGAIVQLTTTGTVDSFNSGTAGLSGYAGNSNMSDTSYSPFIAKLTLTPRLTVPPKSQVAAVNRRDAYILNGLDVFYDFRGVTSGISSALPNLSPNDPTGTYNVGNSGFGGNPGLFSAMGGFQFGFPPQSGDAVASVLTTPYSKSLTAFTAFLVFEHSTSSTYMGNSNSNETPLAKGSFIIQRNGTTANSWEVKIGSTTVGPFTLATDGTVTPANSGIVSITPSYIALVVRWDGTNITVYSSAQIPRDGYTQPLTTLATGTASTTVTGTLYLGSADGSFTNPFYGTESDLLLYSRALSDAELIQNMDALRVDMASRGQALLP